MQEIYKKYIFHLYYIFCDVMFAFVVFRAVHKPKWNEHINLAKEREKTNMDFVPENQQLEGGLFLEDGEKRVASA